MTKPKIYNFLACVFLIITINIGNHSLHSDRNNIYQSQAETGISPNKNKFFYFDYYLNLYPLKSIINPEQEDLSKEKALEKLSNVNLLEMEEGHVVRFGGFFINYLFYFDALFFKNILNPSLKTFNIIFFNFALLLTMLAFFSKKKYLLGTIFCYLISSNPFQIYEVYHNENIFGNFISISLILSSFYIFITKFDKNKYYFYHVVLYSLLSVFVIVFFIFIRSSFIVFIFPFLISFFFLKLDLTKKIFNIIFSIIFFVSLNFTFQNIVDTKLDKTKNILLEKNGRYLDVPLQFHERYFPIYIGLNEFKTKLNFGFWHDDEGNAVLEKENFVVTDIMSKKSNNGYNLHPVNEIEGYDEYFKNEIIRIVKQDYYLVPNLIYNRINYSLNNLTPVQLNLILFKITFDNKFLMKFFLVLYFLLIITLIRKKSYHDLYLTILFSSGSFFCLLFPPSLGLSYYIISHYFLFSLLTIKIISFIKK